jgi:hypothetical protein
MLYRTIFLGNDVILHVTFADLNVTLVRRLQLGIDDDKQSKLEALIIQANETEKWSMNARVCTYAQVGLKTKVSSR